MPIAFGTDGIRGKAGEWPIVTSVARSVGAAAARWADGGEVLVGWDTRPSSEGLAHVVAQGAGGALMAGVVPTAAIQVAVAARNAIGVMVTASHNPARDNGFKLLGPGGRKPGDEDCAKLARWIEDDPTIRAGAPRPDPEIRRGWLDALRTAVPDRSELKGKKVVVDFACGAASPHVEELRAWLPCEIVPIGVSGVINQGCGTEHLEHLAAAVKAHGADAGIALDGDADRCRIVSEKGVEISGDALAWLLARHLEVTGLAVTVMSTLALEAWLPSVKIVRTPVGDRHLREAMDRDGLALGAEDSGHVLFGDHAGGDGILTGVRGLVAAFSRGTVSKAVSSFRAYPRKLTKITVQRRLPLEEALGEAVRAGEIALGRGGRVFPRYSGTENVLRVLVEGTDASLVELVSATVTEEARRVLG